MSIGMKSRYTIGALLLTCGMHLVHTATPNTKNTPTEQEIGINVVNDIKNTLKDHYLNLLASSELASWSDIKQRIEIVKQATELFEAKHAQNLKIDFSKAPTSTEPSSATIATTPTEPSSVTTPIPEEPEEVAAPATIPTTSPMTTPATGTMMSTTPPTPEPLTAVTPSPTAKASQDMGMGTPTQTTPPISSLGMGTPTITNEMTSMAPTTDMGMGAPAPIVSSPEPTQDMSNGMPMI